MARVIRNSTAGVPTVLYHGTRRIENVDSILAQGIRPADGWTYLTRDLGQVSEATGSTSVPIFAVRTSGLDLERSPRALDDTTYRTAETIPPSAIIGVRWISQNFAEVKDWSKVTYTIHSRGPGRPDLVYDIDIKANPYWYNEVERAIDGTMKGRVGSLRVRGKATLAAGPTFESMCFDCIEAQGIREAHISDRPPYLDHCVYCDNLRTCRGCYRGAMSPRIASDYEMDHRPLEDAAPMHDLSATFPDDVYDHPEWYSFGEWTAEAGRVLRQAQGKPDAQITIYRALPAGENEINTGDWVTTVRSYAALHLQKMERGREWHIVSATVPARTLRTGGNDIIEWGYWGPSTSARTAASRRNGLATRMLEYARAHTPVPIEHSNTRNVDGRGWSRAVGSVRSPITYTHDDGSWPAVIALHEDQVVGQLMLDHQGDHWDVVNIFVEPAYQGQGIATSMYEHALANLTKGQPFRHRGDNMSGDAKGLFPALERSQPGKHIYASGIRYYHGTHHELAPGTVLRPSATSGIAGNWGYGPGNDSASSVWLTDDLGRARRWAEDGAWAWARRNGKTMDEALAFQQQGVHVYEVEPIGGVQQKPDGVWMDYAVPEARVLREVTSARTAGVTGKDFHGQYGNTQHITRTEEGTIPTAAIANMVGVRGEIPGDHRNKKGEVWEEFKADIAANGILEPIFITVDPDEMPKISEGNHRRDAAVENGMDEVPVEIRYFGRAEVFGTVMERFERGHLARRRSKAIVAAKPDDMTIEVTSKPFRDPFMRVGPEPRLSDDGIIYEAHFVYDDGQSGDGGYMRLRRRLSDGVWEIWRISVPDASQRKGIASAMLEQARKDLGRVDHAPDNERTSDGRAWSFHVGAREPVLIERDGHGYRYKLFHGTTPKVIVEDPAAGGQVGYLSLKPRSWGGEGYEILSVEVDSEYQRQGVATFMLELARKQYGTVTHSSDLTDDGKAWSQHVGGLREQYEFEHALLAEHGPAFDLPSPSPGRVRSYLMPILVAAGVPGAEKLSVKQDTSVNGARSYYSGSMFDDEAIPHIDFGRWQMMNKLIALHEAAHLIDRKDRPFEEADHGSSWQAIYRRLAQAELGLDPITAAGPERSYEEEVEAFLAQAKAEGKADFGSTEELRRFLDPIVGRFNVRVQVSHRKPDGTMGLGAGAWTYKDDGQWVINIRPEKATKDIALHEAAHVLDVEKNGWPSGGVSRVIDMKQSWAHGPTFQEELRKLTGSITSSRTRGRAEVLAP